MSEEDYLAFGLQQFESECDRPVSDDAVAAFGKHYRPVARLFVKNPDDWPNSRVELAHYLRIQGRAASLFAELRFAPEIEAEHFEKAVALVSEEKLQAGTSLCRPEALPAE